MRHQSQRQAQFVRGWWQTGQYVTRSLSLFSPTPAVIIRYAAKAASVANTSGLAGRPVMPEVSTRTCRGDIRARAGLFCGFPERFVPWRCRCHAAEGGRCWAPCRNRI